MTTADLNQLKQELINLIVQYEKTERKRSVLNNIYFLQFYNELEQQRYLQYENQYLLKAITMKSDGKSDDDVKDYLDQCRKEFAIEIQAFHRQHQVALGMEKQNKKYTKEDLDKVEQEFYNYCSNYHPLLKLQVTEQEQNIYSSLIMLYRSQNIIGFNNLFKEFIPLLSPLEIKEAEEEKFIQGYQQAIEKTKLAISKMNEEFPMNKENIFYTESLITREAMYLREKNYEYREMNKSIQADFKLHFSFEFSL